MRSSPSSLHHTPQETRSSSTPDQLIPQSNTSRKRTQSKAKQSKEENPDSKSGLIHRLIRKRKTSTNNLVSQLEREESGLPQSDHDSDFYFFWYLLLILILILIPTSLSCSIHLHHLHTFNMDEGFHCIGTYGGREFGACVCGGLM